MFNQKFLFNKALIILFFPLFHLQAKVYDCFPFFNEFEILKIRLNELNEEVDYFVLVESIETQRGEEKPLYFEENKELFQPFLDKIIHVAIKERHPELSGWEREYFQREQIMRGLKDRCSENDVIIISDADEIPKKEVIAELSKKISAYPYDAYRLKQKIYFFQLNRIFEGGVAWRGEPFWGSIVTSYGIVSKTGIQFIRFQREKLKSKAFDAGWHFTYMGGFDQVRKKIKSIVEGYDTDNLTDIEIQAMIDKHEVVPLDDSYPSYILENLDHFKSIGFIAE